MDNVIPTVSEPFHRTFESEAASRRHICRTSGGATYCVAHKWAQEKMLGPSVTINIPCLRHLRQTAGCIDRLQLLNETAKRLGPPTCNKRLGNSGSLSEKSISVPLCDLCASVVSVFSSNFTTETQRFFHGGTEKCLFQPDSDRVASAHESAFAVLVRQPRHPAEENSADEECRIPNSI